MVPAVADPPAVSVVTATWQRHDLLLARCVPAVAAQDYPALEHIIVSDGPDPELRGKLDGLPRVRYAELPAHDPEAQWGHYARLHGIDLAKGDYIAYLDDDNSWRPGHVQILAAALQETGAGFAYGMTAVHGRGDYVIGADPPSCGQIDTSAIMHRRGLLDLATWRWHPGIETIDWDLVSRWMAAGATWVAVPAITADYWFRD
jgi:glycosyltransferase involved in cell wall biosynthesis